MQWIGHQKNNILNWYSASKKGRFDVLKYCDYNESGINTFLWNENFKLRSYNSKILLDLRPFTLSSPLFLTYHSTYFHPLCRLLLTSTITSHLNLSLNPLRWPASLTFLRFFNIFHQLIQFTQPIFQLAYFTNLFELIQPISSTYLFY